MLRIQYDTFRAGYAAGWHSMRAYEAWLQTKAAADHAVAAQLFAIYEDLYADIVEASGVYSRAVTVRPAA